MIKFESEMNALKNIYVWCRRFRKRRGYGVHSPFAFDFITSVINEKGRYYAYDQIKGKQQRLIFRITNYVQPKLIISVGSNDVTKAMRLAKPSARILEIESEKDLESFDYEKNVDLLFASNNSDLIACFENVYPLLNSNSVIIVEAIHSNKRRLSAWKKLKEDERTGISFDTYTHGIIMFDKSRYKQHYIVNF